jgi:predicted Zn finger-like uncharacterized protein
MKIACPSCKYSFEVEKERLPPEGRELTCPKCRCLFFVHPDKDDATKIINSPSSSTKILQLGIGVFLILIVCSAVYLLATSHYKEGGSQPASANPQASDCDRAKAQFQACEGRSGDSYINCIANINAPAGCGETSLQHLSDKVNSR